MLEFWNALSPGIRDLVITGIIGILKVVIVFHALLGLFSLMTLIERRVLGFMQFRLGPNRTGPQGILQPLADGVKLFFKEEFMPNGANKFLFFAAPIVAVVTAFMAIAVVPYGGPLKLGFLKTPLSWVLPDSWVNWLFNAEGQIQIFGRPFDLQIVDLDVGILYIFAVTALGVYAIVFAGYASNNKYALIGGLRSSAQMFSASISLGLSWVPVIMLAESFRLGDIVNAAQRMGVWYWILAQSPAFLLYFVSACAEVNRTPFDLPEGETELVAGFHVEYSSMKFALIQMAEYVNMITVCALASAMFLGGWLSLLPGVIPDSPLWFFAKMGFLLFVFIWLRATVPRFRYDQLMNLGWKRLIPAATIWIVVFAGLVTFFGEKKSPPTTVAEVRAR